MTKRPNIVVLIADDTDPNNLGCYGAEDYLTPHLDELAAGGMRFTRANAVSPVCTPSRYAYLTGQFPSTCPNNFLANNPTTDVPNITWNTDLAPGQENLATICKANGYRTGYVGKFHAGRGSSAIGMKPLPPQHDPYDPENDAIHRHNQGCIQNELQSYGWDDVRCATWGNLDFNQFHDVPHNVEWTTHGITSFLSDHAADEQPFCLYVGYHTIHGPKHGEDIDQLDPRVTAGGLWDGAESSGHPSRSSILERLRTAGLDPYHRNVGALYMDDSIGVVLDTLDELGIADDTIVIFKADHGKYAKATVYNNGSQVPMIWRWPGVVEAGSVNRTFVQNTDFLPTLVESLELNAGDYRFDGDSYWAQLQGSQEALRTYHYNEMGMTRSIQTDRWKYVSFRYQQDMCADIASGACAILPNHIGKPGGEAAALYHSAYYEPDQLYEIQQDKGEHVNLIDQPDYQQVLQELKTALRKIEQELPHQHPETAPAVMLDEQYPQRIIESREFVRQDGRGQGTVFGDRYW